MELKQGQYDAASKLLKTADEALLTVIASIKRHDELSRIRRGIEEAESLLKKVKRELHIG